MTVPTAHCHRTQDALPVQTSKLRPTLPLSLPQQLRHRFSGRTQCSGSLVWLGTSGSQLSQDLRMSPTARHRILCREGEGHTVPSAEYLPTFRRNVPTSRRSVKWLKAKDRRLQPTRSDCCDALNTCIGSVVWFASNGIICTGLRKVQYCEILWRVLTMVSAFDLLKGHYMYRTVVTICTASLTSNNSTFYPHNVFMCFVWISEQTAIISLYNIN